MDVLAELLSLYGRHPTGAIEAAAGDGILLLTHFKVADRDQLLAIEGYSEAFEMVSACAATVDGLAERYPDRRDQVRESVRLLRRMVDDGQPVKKLEATRYLVEARLRESWLPEEQDDYERLRTKEAGPRLAGFLRLVHQPGRRRHQSAVSAADQELPGRAEEPGPRLELSRPRCDAPPATVPGAQRILR